MNTLLTILVVDNDPTVRTLLDRVLRQLGFEVVNAASGADAVDLFQKHAISIVLLDVEMPDLDGPETLKKLLAIGPIACVFMTGGSTYTKNQLLGFGACDVIQKPFGFFEDVVEKLRKCVEKHAIKYPAHPPGQMHRQDKKP